MNPALPPNWATLQQPPPRNHGTPAIDALRPGQPLREVVGEMLADAAIVRAAVGEKTYGSKLTPNNGRDQAIDALQELADAAAYLAAWRAEIGSMDDDDAFRESEGVECAMHQLNNLAWTINAAAKYRAKRLAKRLAKTKGEKEMNAASSFGNRASES